MEYDLTRFVEAQKKQYKQALAEIKNGKKETHWMWYIFPQMSGLGFSSIAEYYGIENMNEALAYLENDYLKNNLIEISECLYNLDVTDVSEVLGYPDDLKLKSSMTLFNTVRPDIEIFKKVLDKYYNGSLDKRTLDLLKR